MALSRVRRGARVTAIVLAVGLGLGLGIASAGGDDRTAAETLLRTIDASPRKETAREMVTRARGALDKAKRLREGGDEAHARLEDGVALRWAEAAKSTLDAIETEQKATTAKNAANDAGVVADRERALLEEGIAQAGRIRAQLEAATKQDKSGPARTSTTANTLTTADAGATTKPKKPAADGGTAPRDGIDGGAK